MMRFKIPVLALICLITTAFSLRAGEEGPKPEILVKAEVDKAFITIGDPVDYTVTISRRPEVTLLSVIPPPAKDLFKIKKIQDFKHEENGYLVSGKKFTLTSFRLGEFILDPVKIEYRLNGEDQIKSISTNKIFLTVQSVSEGQEPQTDIRDVKPVISIPRNWWPWIIALVVVLTAMISLLIYDYVKKKKPVLKAPERILTPEEEALLHLSQLFDSDFLRNGKYRDYFFRLSEILRIYIEKRYKVTAVESTTCEIMRDLKSLDLPRDLKEKIREVLEGSDLAKFAKWKPEPQDITTMNRKATQIVEEFRPSEVPAGGV